MGRRRISQPVFLLPKNEQLGRCSFRKGCARECVPPFFANFDELMKRKLSGEISYWLSKIKNGKGDHWKERNRSVDELRMLLQGSVMPGAQVGSGKYCACGAAVPILNLKMMQNFSIDEIREASEGVDFSIPLHGAYSTSASPQPTGLNSHFAMLLARIAVNEMEGERGGYLLRALEIEGGLGGARALSLIATEPTTPFHIRSHFLDSLEAVANCVDFGADEPQVLDGEIALSVSRFSTMEIVLCESECGMVPAARPGKNAPPLPEEPEMGRIRQMCSSYFGEIFQSMMNIAARMDALIHSEKGEVGGKGRDLVEFYLNLRKTIMMIAGQGNINQGLAIQMLERKERGIYGSARSPEEKRAFALEALDADDMGVAKAAVEMMRGEGILDGECARKLSGLLVEGMNSRRGQVEEIVALAAGAQERGEFYK